jgi:hypothetical protein
VVGRGCLWGEEDERRKCRRVNVVTVFYIHI